MEIRKLPEWVQDENDLELYHHGIKGQRWGVRRFQNEDGSYTWAGRKRYGIGEKMSTTDKSDSSVTRKVKNDYNTLSDQEFINKYRISKNTYRKRVNRYGDPYQSRPDRRDQKRYGIAMNTNNRKKLVKYSKYLNDEELKNRTDRFKDIDYLSQKQVKQYSEGQKMAMRMAERVLTAAIITGVAVVGAKYVKKQVKNSPLYNELLDNVKKAKEKGEAAVKTGKAIKETVNGAADAIKNVKSTTEKIVGNPNELKARLAAQDAVRRGLSKEVARKIYKKILNEG